MCTNSRICRHIHALIIAAMVWSPLSAQQTASPFDTLNADCVDSVRYKYYERLYLDINCLPPRVRFSSLVEQTTYGDVNTTIFGDMSSMQSHTGGAMRMIGPNGSSERYPFLLAGADLRSSKFGALSCAHMEYFECTLTGLDLHEAFLHSVLYLRCDLRQVNFVGVHLSDCEFEHCDLRGMRFDPRYMDAATRESLLQGNNRMDDDLRLYLTVLGPTPEDKEVL